MLKAITVASLLLIPTMAQATGRSPMPSNGPFYTGGWGSGVLAVAGRYQGSLNPTGLRGPWCRDFVNMVLEQSGHRLANHSRRAIDALGLGYHVSSPQPGDLAVMGGHVTFFKEWDGPNSFIGRGGNQGHIVRDSRFPRYSVVAWVRPY
jgi:uncharacterized protein (TIGR02594 family)